jgi:hypothetical protein
MAKGTDLDLISFQRFCGDIGSGPGRYKMSAQIRLRD